jgi:hypothetical protein
MNNHDKYSCLCLVLRREGKWAQAAVGWTAGNPYTSGHRFFYSRDIQAEKSNPRFSTGMIGLEKKTAAIEGQQ